MQACEKKTSDDQLLLWTNVQPQMNLDEIMTIYPQARIVKRATHQNDADVVQYENTLIRDNIFTTEYILIDGKLTHIELFPKEELTGLNADTLFEELKEDLLLRYGNPFNDVSNNITPAHSLRHLVWNIDHLKIYLYYAKDMGDIEGCILRVSFEFPRE